MKKQNDETKARDASAVNTLVMPPCDECGTTDPADEVVKSEIEWYAWGRNCFDMNWKQVREEKHLCDECERTTYEICNECGARISRNFYGIGYLPDDWEGDHICPGCAKEEGLEITCDLQPLSKAG